ncbi:hypothetical protein ACIGXM_13060 [Kitasatospora sp. NPDC052896]|uniref:hypothetical protein n=1 Tax=Kitasatospora sp. NPDC052896 TaxID=3364061 RepID=UPI0037C7DE20
MHRSPGRPDPLPEENEELSRWTFGEPAAFLVGPPARWRRSVESGSTDGHPWSLEVHYHAERRRVLSVRTIRELPASVRRRPLDDLASPLLSFRLHRAAADRAATGVRELLTRAGRGIAQLPEREAALTVDGIEVRARMIEASDSYAIRARLATLTVVLCAEHDLGVPPAVTLVPPPVRRPTEAEH